MFGCRTASAPACCLFLRTARHTCSDQSMLSSCWAAAVFGQSAYTNDFLGFQASRAFQRLRPSSYWSTRRRPVKHTLQVCLNVRHRTRLCTAYVSQQEFVSPYSLSISTSTTSNSEVSHVLVCRSSHATASSFKRASYNLKANLFLHHKTADQATCYR